MSTPAASPAPLAPAGAAPPKFQLTDSGKKLEFTTPLSSMQEFLEVLGTGLARPEAILALEFNYEYEDDTVKLDFDVDLSRALPKLESLEMKCFGFSGFKLHSKSLLALSLENPIPGSFEGGAFSFRLPKLESLSLQFADLPYNADFGPSLSASPSLRQINTYKLWGLDRLSAHLPCVTNITMTRSDGLRAISLYCPRLENLNLMGCHEISSVRFLKRGKAAHGHLNLKESEMTTGIVVNVQSIVSRRLPAQLEAHPRVGRVYKSKDDGGDGGFF